MTTPNQSTHTPYQGPYGSFWSAATVANPHTYSQDFNEGAITGDFADLVGNNTLASLLDETSYCLAAIAAFDIDPTENLYVVGDTFLKNWYSIYSYDAADGNPAVSFAKSV